MSTKWRVKLHSVYLSNGEFWLWKIIYSLRFLQQAISQEPYCEYLLVHRHGHTRSCLESMTINNFMFINQTDEWWSWSLMRDNVTATATGCHDCAMHTCDSTLELMRKADILSICYSMSFSVHPWVTQWQSSWLSVVDSLSYALMWWCVLTVSCYY